MNKQENLNLLKNLVIYKHNYRDWFNISQLPTYYIMLAKVIQTLTTSHNNHFNFFLFTYCAPSRHCKMSSGALRFM